FKGSHDLVLEDFTLVDRAPALLLETALALFVQRVEGEVLTFGRPVELDGDADHAESDGAFPDWSRHTGHASVTPREFKFPFGTGPRTLRIDHTAEADDQQPDRANRNERNETCRGVE